MNIYFLNKKQKIIKFTYKLYPLSYELFLFVPTADLMNQKFVFKSKIIFWNSCNCDVRK